MIDKDDFILGLSWFKGVTSLLIKRNFNGVNKLSKN